MYKRAERLRTGTVRLNNTVNVTQRDQRTVKMEKMRERTAEYVNMARE
jgi:hypothetical protein